MKLYSITQSSDSQQVLELISSLLEDFIEYFTTQLPYIQPCIINLLSDPNNSKNILGNTGFYNPSDYSVNVYIDNRHPKDILRSIAHELVHHYQNCNNKLQGDNTSYEEGYAQKNSYMRKLELEAFEKGNIIFRDWTDILSNDQQTLMETKIKKMATTKKQVLKENTCQQKTAQRLGKKVQQPIKENEDFLENESEENNPAMDSSDHISDELDEALFDFLKKKKEKTPEEIKQNQEFDRQRVEHDAKMDALDRADRRGQAVYRNRHYEDGLREELTENEEQSDQEWYRDSLHETLMKKWCPKRK